MKCPLLLLMMGLWGSRSVIHKFTGVPGRQGELCGQVKDLSIPGRIGQMRCGP